MIFWEFLTLLQEIRWEDILDIALASMLLWLGIDALRRARARAAGTALLAFGVLFLVAKQLEMNLTVWILQGLAALSVLIVVIVFQNEIRLLLERFPSLFVAKRNHPPSEGIAEILSEALGRLSSARRGALVVLPRRDPLEAFTTEGVPLDGRLTFPLLLSIFDPNSPGHDGALIVEGSRAVRFGVHLPLSQNSEQLQGRGTRHAAALGLAEKTDALVLVVSEETGKVSAARAGTLLPLPGTGEVLATVTAFLEEQGEPRVGPRVSAQILRKEAMEGVSAVFLALLLWLFLVPGGEIATQDYSVPLKVQNVPPGFTLQEVVPAEVTVTLSGPKRKLFLYDSGDLEIPVDATLTSLGRQTFFLTSASILLPPDLEVAAIDPPQIKIFVEKK